MSDDAATPDPETTRLLWRFAPMIYGPTVLFSLGEGAVLPLLPVLATRLGANVSQAALLASVIVVAQLIGNIPAAWAVGRYGERATMLAAGVLSLAGAVGIVLAPNLGVLGVAVFAIGFSAAAFGLARHAFMTTRVPIALRARSLSLLGGSFRFGVFVGPFVAALLLAVFGHEVATAWFFAICLIALLILVWFGTDPEDTIDLAVPTAVWRPEDAVAGDSGEPTTGAIPAIERAGVFRTMWRNRGVLSRVGLSAASLSGIRSARVYVLPLWGVSIGLDASHIALVVGIAGAVEFALFYTSGQVMDRWGRLWAVLPSMIVMGGAFAALSLTHDLTDAAVWFTVIAVAIGAGNGLSSGILLTIGADLAPAADPASFLGAWRTLTDAGGAAAPLLVAGLTALWSLTAATGAIGVLGLAGAVGFAVWLPRYVPRRP